MRSFLTHALMLLALVLSESSISQAHDVGPNEASEMGLLAQARGKHRRPQGKRTRQRHKQPA